jgi:cytochrome c-type biogenesis protein CcmH/NrfG
MKNFPLFSLCFLALLLSGCQTFSAQDAYDNAIKLTQSGKNTEAVTAYNQAIKLHGDQKPLEVATTQDAVSPTLSNTQPYNKDAELYYNRAIAKSNL